MGFPVDAHALRVGWACIVFGALAGCTTYVPLSKDYTGPDAFPLEGPAVFPKLPELPLAVTEDSEARERSRFVVRQMSLPSAVDSSVSIDFEYYDADGDERIEGFAPANGHDGGPPLVREVASEEPRDRQLLVEHRQQ